MTLTPFFGCRIPVLALPSLIAAKRAAGCPKDLLARPQLARIKTTPRLRDLQRAKGECDSKAGE